MSRISRSLLVLPAAPVVFASAILAGCGRADSDREAREKLDKAYAYRAAGDAGNNHVTLANEVAQSQAGDATMALAHELVGDVSVELAAAVIAGRGREPEPGLGALQTSCIVLAEQANRLATALALSGAFVQVQQQRDPEAALAALEQQLGAVQAGEGWTPGPGVEGQLPALEPTQKRLDALNARLGELNGQIAQLEQQRADLLAQASEFDEQSDQQQGQESVETYRKAADLRTQAAEVAAGTERLRAQARQTTAELEQVQALRAALEEAVATLQQQRDALNRKWSGVQGQIGQINESAQTTFSSEQMDEERGNPQSSLELMSRELAPALSAMAEQREQAVSLLTKAAASYDSAAARATQAASQRNELFRAAFAEAFNGSRISLSRAIALRNLGAVHAASAGAFSAVLQLEQTLQESGRNLPESVQQAMSESARDSFIQAVDAAAQAYSEANEILARLSSGGSARGPIGQSALTHRAAVVAGLWGLQSLASTTGVPVTAQLPSEPELVQIARDLAAAAQNADAPLPVAAPFVGGAGLAPATEPSTQPTPEPATQGAGGEAETTQPAEEGAAEPGTGETGAEGGGAQGVDGAAR